MLRAWNSIPPETWREIGIKDTPNLEIQPSTFVDDCEVKWKKILSRGSLDTNYFLESELDTFKSIANTDSFKAVLSNHFLLSDFFSINDGFPSLVKLLEEKGLWDFLKGSMRIGENVHKFIRYPNSE